MLFGGLRASEVLSLTLDNFKCVAGSEEFYFLSFTGKGDKERFTYIKRDLIEFELNNINQYISNKDYIASTSSKKQMDRFQLFKMVRSMYKSAGIKQTGLHILRHTFAKSLIENKTSLPTVQKLLGHNDIKTTMVYINPHQDTILSELKSK